MILSPLAFFIYFLAGIALAITAVCHGIMWLLNWDVQRQNRRKTELYYQHLYEARSAWLNRSSDPQHWKDWHKRHGHG
jgi:hypothetical protein